MKTEWRIAQLRREKKMSQTELAEHLGVSRQTVSAWETGLRTPTPRETVRMCSLFFVSADYLVGRTNQRTFIKTFITEEIDITRLNAAGINALTEYYHFLLMHEEYTKYDV